jgi:electron transport complex protein RnfC
MSTNTSHKLWKIHGGVHPPFHKEESTQLPIKSAGIPKQLVLPIQQHIGSPAEPLVAIGDKVYKGQLIAKANTYISANIHAPTSGSITAIEDLVLPHPSGLKGLSIVIETDGKDNWGETGKYPSYEKFSEIEPELLLNRIQEAGVVGLGGAVFPTSVKVDGATKNNIDTFIINGAECEPYITCDDQLMREKSAEIIDGIRIIQHMINPAECLIGIEDNKPEAIKAMQQACKNDPKISVVSVPTIYPSGDIKQLTKILTGIEIPSGTRSVNSGILGQNVGTVYSIYQAIVEGIPTISRITTVTGNGVQHPQNFEVLNGTAFSFLAEQSGGYTKMADHLIMGGPMMGFQLKSDQVPVVKATNCILVSSEDQLAYSDDLAMPCIRCGKCAEACPVDLLPQQLYWYARSENHPRAEQHHLFNCIECGCCSYVCPSRIPLVQYYRHAKAQIREQRTLKDNAELARQRFEFREFRQQREKEERAAMRAAHKRKVQQKMSNNGDKKAVILAAMARAKAKKAALLKAKQSTDQNLTE